MERLKLVFGAILLLLLGCQSDSDNRGLTGWAVGSSAEGYGTIINTQDGEDTWVRQGSPETVPDVFIDDVVAVDHHRAWVVGGSSGGYATILHTTNGGQTWVRQGTVSNIPDVELMGVSAADREVAWSVGGSGVVLNTTDEGETWVQQAEGEFPDAAFQRVSACDRNNVWAVGIGPNSEPAVIIHTSNGGQTWVRQGENDLPPAVFGLIDVQAVNPNTVWAVGVAYSIWMTQDGGQSWIDKSPPGGPLHVNGICALNDRIAWAAVDSHNILFTYDSGETWTNQASPASVDVSVSSAYMGVTAMDENTAWIVGIANPSSGRKGVIVHTIDGGNRWVEQTLPVNALLRRVSFVDAVR